MAKQTLHDIKNIKGEKVLIRVDFNVPLEGTKITDNARIVKALPTIKYVIDNGGKAIVFSHLGRVKEEKDKEKLSLLPVKEELERLLNKKVVFIDKTRGKELEDAINNLKDGEILMFENTRFEDLDGKKESKNDPELGKYWASLGDVFVNDAFGTAHRAHASNVGIASNIKQTVSGFLLEKEIKFLKEAVDNPKRPFVAILGGAKVSDKIGVIENLIQKADKILIGGGMMFTFLKAQGYETGKSICEMDKLDLAKELLEKGKDKIVLPVDCLLTKEFSNDAKYRESSISDIKEDEMGLDVGPKTIELFKEVLKNVKTVIWNGPMGVFEFDNFAKGTKDVCEILANLKGATTIIGGGDSAAAAEKFGYEDKFSHVSTGGGASLEYLEGKELPGVAALSDK